MATGTYGIIRPADITPSDAEVFYHFTPSRDSIGNTTLTKLNAADVLIPIDNPNKIQSLVTGFELFGGMYTLKLPAATFGVKGFYTIIIKPIEIRTKITDIGVLSAYPDIPVPPLFGPNTPPKVIDPVVDTFGVKPDNDV